MALTIEECVETAEILMSAAHRSLLNYEVERLVEDVEMNLTISYRIELANLYLLLARTKGGL